MTSRAAAKKKVAHLAVVEPAPPRADDIDLGSPELYLNRELTWLAFNARVLCEAEDERTPLLERVKFLAITGSNLDEFFMKRVGGLKQQVAAGVVATTVDGRTARQQLAECYEVVRELQRRQQALVAELRARLRGHGIEILGYGDLPKREQKALRDEFFRTIYPLLTPQSIDPAHPFPFISNLSLNLLVTVRYPGEADLSEARVKVPIGAGAPRFLRVGARIQFVPLEDVIAQNLDLLFPGMEVVDRALFRVTRNANTEKSEEQAEDLLALIESELQDRKFAPVVRLQVMPGMNPVQKGRLAAELGLDEDADVFEPETMLGLRDLMELAALNAPELKDPPHHPVEHPALQASRNIFHLIRESGPFLLQHPYEAFPSSVERFLREAATDPKVRAIKMTLYRTSARSGIVDHLIEAAENGKQVAVAVELKARFDEEANIRLATRMEEAGIHVTYGVVGLKTHSKVILVVRQDYSGLRRYLHVGTGNYHPVTSRIYCDLGLLTCDDAIGADATELFNYLTTGFTPKRDYQKLLVAPKLLKKGLLDRIEREIRLHTADDPGHLQFKMNGLEDLDVCRALYRASIAGVRVDLLVRDSCRVRPGLPGLSENLRVVSIVGRFLEHCRVYYFRNGGQEEYWIGSADAMKRNLEHRVEVLAPVEDPLLRRELRAMLDTQWNDRRSAWDMQPDGTYVQRRPGPGDEPRSSQEVLIEAAERRNKEATRLRKRRSSAVPGRRNTG
ncbi:MAG: polyphosphate kinase 1 [Deferrisomatales bacterium]